jgi:hypothetical protein
MDTFPVLEVNTPETGKFSITVLDPNQILWFGKYQTGRLTVYWADIVEGVPLVPTMPIIYVVSGQDIPEADLFGYEAFAADVTIGAMIDSLMNTINKFYAESVMAARHEQDYKLQ